MTKTPVKDDPVTALPPEVLRDLHRRMVRIRLFEEEAGKLMEGGRMPGFLHLYVGQEAVAAGVMATLRPDDVITSTHRGHGHAVAKGADLRYMYAELFGKVTGYCKGRGGSMHINDLSIGMLGANGIVGGGIPHAVGAAYAAVYKGRDCGCRAVLRRWCDEHRRVPRIRQSGRRAAIACRLRVREQRLRRVHAAGATHVAEGCRRPGGGLRDAQ